MVIANDATDIREIARLLAELRSRDVARRVFGSERHQYREGRRRSESELLAFEREHAIELPRELREYLAVVGDGSGGPAYGVNPLDRMVVDAPRRPATLLGGDGDPRDGVLVVGDEGCAIDVVLVVTGAPVGSIWSVWEDALALAPSFFAWYEGWARQKLRRLDNERLVASVRLGMTVDELHAATGHVWTPRATASRTYCESAEVPVQTALDADGRVAWIRPWARY